MKSKLQNITAMLIFGTIGIFVKNIDLSSKEIALMRGIIGSIFLIFIAMFSKDKISFKGIKKNFILLFISGIGIGINWIFLFQAYKYTTISAATLSYYFAPVFVTLLSPVILKEKLPIIKIVCISAAMLGMFFIVKGTNGNSNFENIAYNHTLGIIYGLSAAIFYGSVILMNKFIKELKSLETTLTQLTLASLVLFPYVMFTDGIKVFNTSMSSLTFLIILGIIHTGFAYFLYFSSIKDLKGQTIAVLSYIDPISAVIISAFLLKESMTFGQVIGGILILSSTFISENYTKLKIFGKRDS